MDLIYARQSVDKEDSISIESQIELCLKESDGAEHKVFKDKGYSGKNTDRPGFQEMMGLVRRGEAARVIVYRLDRISRSVLDFAGLISEFQKHGVAFISVTERFDTSTPIGKAMLMIVMIFAQLERETIQQRITDAYHSRSRRGFFMGGGAPFATRRKSTVIDGVNTGMHEGIPEDIEIVKLIYSLYSEPQTSFADIMRYLSEHNIRGSDGEKLKKTRIRSIVMNPAYVKANDRIYEFFHSQGTEMINDISQFTGTNGAYLYTKKESNAPYNPNLKDHTLVLAPHEGWIDPDTWLKCRRKCLNIPSIAKPVRAKHTWLAGKIKCMNCGYAVTLLRYVKKHGGDSRYFRCFRNGYATDCAGFGAARAEKVEDIVFLEMRDKLNEFSELQTRANPESTLPLTKLKINLEQKEKEIGTLVEKVLTANKTTMEYINQKIEELDEQKQELKKKIADMKADLYGKAKTDVIKNYLSNWENVSISDKITVADALIDRVKINKDTVEIIWKV
jgi:DNA invertase Pin-like site-specific DNA recombinase